MTLFKVLSQFFWMELGHGKIMVRPNARIFLIIQCMSFVYFILIFFRHTIIRDTATARRSSIVDFKKSLSARKSVIAEALG